MKLELVTKNYNASEKLQTLIENKLGKLDKYFYDDAVAHVNLEKIGNTNKHRMEISIRFAGKLLRAEAISDNMYNNIDEIEQKLDRQIRKNRTRLASKIRVEEVQALEEPIEEIVKTKSFRLVELSVDEAIGEMELSGHDFYIFLNSETGKASVVYRREDGNFGLLVPEY